MGDGSENDGGGDGDDDLPDMFVAKRTGLVKTYRIIAMRSAADGQWRMESTVSIPVVGDMARFAPRPVDDDHVRHIYENYEVVREQS